jgi:L-alanine-DL-glutamate epimerase-like enolase superfamily enzyme
MLSVRGRPSRRKRVIVTPRDERADRSSLLDQPRMQLILRTRVEKWPIAGSFVISRGARTEAEVVVAEISDGRHTGRGEAVPYRRYGETVAGVLEQIETAPRTFDRQALRGEMPAGAARNAIDCALWDLEAKASGSRAWHLAGLARLRPVVTAYTLNLGEPETMAHAARAALHYPLLKLKLGGAGDPARLRAVRAAAPDARLIVDANEAWSERNFAENLDACQAAGVELIEQPLPADADSLLSGVSRDVPICADESLHTTADLDRVAGRYDAVNIKLDKAGGLTEALDLAAEARRRGFKLMVGCIVGTSLAIAPALIVAQQADFADLDGPLLLAKDRVPGLSYLGATISPPPAELWG